MTNSNHKAYDVLVGDIEIVAATFQPLRPVTIFLPLEPIQDSLNGSYGATKANIVSIIGELIVAELTSSSTTK